MEENKIGLIILAAGASTRLGTPKQLLNFKGETLLHRIARKATTSVCRPVIVVLGCEFERLKDEITNLDVHIIKNSEWKEGMASSIRAGIKKLLEINESAEAVVLTVCDQPFVSAELINKLVETFQKSQKPVISSAYQNTIGVPALFSKILFPQLKDLNGNRGAKQIINQFQSQGVSLPFPDGAIDIDTSTDFEKLRSKS